MSTAAFPTLPGLAWPVVRSPKWQTRIQTSVSGKRLSLADWSIPRHKWSLTYNFVRGYSSFTEWKTLEAFFGARQGSFDSFLYTDPNDLSVTLSTLGVGDSTNRAFQLSRVFGSTVASYSEPIYGPVALSALVIGGTTYGSTQYTLQYWGSTAPGMVTFSSFAPTSTESVLASFTYAWPVAFDQDNLDFEEFVKQIWALKSVSWTSLK